MIRSLMRTYAILSKEFTQLRRDRVTFSLITAMPIVQLLMFGYAINMDPRHLPAAVYASDHSSVANAVVSAMEHTNYVDIRYLPQSEAEMDRLLRRGKVMLGLTIPPDFTQRVLKGDHAQVLAEIDASDPTAAAGAVVAVSTLPAGTLDQAMVGPLAGASAGAPPRGPPFEVVVHKLYNPESISTYNIVPGMLGIVLTITLVMMTAMSVTREHERGTMETLLSTPATPLEIMVGKLTPYVIMGLLQTVLFLVLAKLLFAIPLPQNGAGWLALGVGMMLFVLANLGLGYLISTLARNQLQATQMTLFYMLFPIFLSGFAFPYYGLPPWARVISNFTPVTYFLRILRGALLKQQVLSDMGPNLLALGLFVLVVTTVALARSRTTLD